MGNRTGIRFQPLFLRGLGARCPSSGFLRTENSTGRSTRGHARPAAWPRWQGSVQRTPRLSVLSTSPSFGALRVAREWGKSGS